MRGGDRTQADGDLGFNVLVHTMDASFFGLGLGLASFGSVVPLFLHRHTESALLLGTLGSIHLLGWHLPQLATAKRVARLQRYMPMVMAMTTLERLPFLALAALAWTEGAAPGRLSGSAVVAAVLGLVFLVGIGGGLTANPFQAMVARIIPARRRTVFYGLKAAAANLLVAAGAEIAGRLLEGSAAPSRFALCFLLAALATAVSWVFLSLTREGAARERASERAALAESPPSLEVATPSPAPASASPTISIAAISPDPDTDPDTDLEPSHPPLPTAGSLLKADSRFRWYLVTRALSQLGHMAAGFYTVYAIQRFDAGPLVVARLTAVFALSQTLANPIMGWAADRWGFRDPKRLGLAASGLGALVAMAARSPQLLYLSMALAGVAAVAIFTFPLAMNVQFGDDRNRAVYIGLSSTLTAPAIVGAPILGGWLADALGFQPTFALAALGAGAAIVALERMRRLPGLA